MQLHRLVTALPLVGRAPESSACRCQHQSAAHQHYRAGTDCALCDCARFRRSRSASPLPELAPTATMLSFPAPAVPVAAGREHPGAA